MTTHEHGRDSARRCARPRRQDSRRRTSTAGDGGKHPAVQAHRRHRRCTDCLGHTPASRRRRHQPRAHTQGSRRSPDSVTCSSRHRNRLEQGVQKGGGTRGTQRNPVSTLLTLAEMGIDKKTSALAQKLAGLSDTERNAVAARDKTLAEIQTSRFGSSALSVSRLSLSLRPGNTGAGSLALRRPTLAIRACKNRKPCHREPVPLNVS